MENKKLERGSCSKNNSRAWADLGIFQLNIAERWLERGNEAKDLFAKFFFYFTGFNAIYFLWRKIDRLDETNEGAHIENLIKKFGEVKAQEILDNVMSSIDYFCNKRGPIQRMDKRNAGNPSKGKESEGNTYQRKLKDNSQPALERIIALGRILYLVRSNLVHGSKAESGDDEEIIQMSIEPLKVFLTEAISCTKQ